MPNSGTEDGIASVMRALLLLEELSESGSLGATDLASRLGTTKATSFRLARTLQARGYVVQGSDSRYRLGPSCLTLGDRARQGMDLRIGLRPTLEALHALTDETVQLTVLSGREVIYLDQLLSPKPVLSVSQIGARSPAHCVSPGLALLAALPDDHLEAFLLGPLERHTDRTITAPDALRAEIAAARRRGYTVNLGGYRPDVGGVGAAILDHQAKPVAAVSVCVPTYRLEQMDLGQLGSHVRRAATEASESLGLRRKIADPVA
jgi:DNA-binding IclR family transcriptional regulator